MIKETADAVIRKFRKTFARQKGILQELDEFEKKKGDYEFNDR